LAFVIAYDAPPTLVVVLADSAHVVVADDNVCYYFCRFKFILALSKGMRSTFLMFSWRPGGDRAGEDVHVVWRDLLSPLDHDDNKAF
jgi:hypothetical protein